LDRGGLAAVETKEIVMTPLRCRTIEDMRLAGLTARSQAIYVKAVRRLAAYYRRSPDELSEEEVRAYLVKLRERGAARGTFKVALYAVTW
jgi:hypothetical protein